MGLNSNIAWTEATWNIARGCTKVVDETPDGKKVSDCLYCYMYRDSFNGTRYNPLQVVRTKTVFDLPLRTKDPTVFFTSSLTDFFHSAIDSYRHEAWDIIVKCPHHTFQILTKRPERIDEQTPPFLGMHRDHYLKNVWMGTSVGSQASIGRAMDLLHSAWRGIKFLSLEPLHGPITLDDIPHDLLDNLSWVIIGGESGNETGKYRYRPCKLEWIEALIDECRSHSIPVFVKQLGTHLAKELKLKSRHGTDPSEWPEHLQIQEMPNLEFYGR